MEKGSKGLFRRILSTFIPVRCAICDEVTDHPSGICPQCRERYPVRERPICPRCGRSVSGSCECAGRPFAFDRAISLYVYTGQIAEAVLRLKREQDRYTDEAFGTLLAELVRREYGQIPLDGICLVPSSSHRKRSFGFHQCEGICQVMAKKLSLPILRNVLKDVSHRRAQHLVAFEKRWENVSGAYRCVRPEAVKGKQLLLLDDIMTSGASLSEVATALKKEGAEKVFCVTICTADSSGRVAE